MTGFEKEQVLHREKQRMRGNIWRLLKTQRASEVQRKAKQEAFVCSGAEERDTQRSVRREGLISPRKTRWKLFMN